MLYSLGCAFRLLKTTPPTITPKTKKAPRMKSLEVRISPKSQKEASSLLLKRTTSTMAVIIPKIIGFGLIAISFLQTYINCLVFTNGMLNVAVSEVWDGGGMTRRRDVQENMQSVLVAVAPCRQERPMTIGNGRLFVCLRRCQAYNVKKGRCYHRPLYSLKNFRNYSATTSNGT